MGIDLILFGLLWIVERIMHSPLVMLPLIALIILFSLDSMFGWSKE